MTDRTFFVVLFLSFFSFLTLGQGCCGTLVFDEVYDRVISSVALGMSNITESLTGLAADHVPSLVRLKRCAAHGCVTTHQQDKFPAYKPAPQHHEPAHDSPPPTALESAQKRDPKYNGLHARPDGHMCSELSGH